jgi:tetratricopeptide (TPR) repeat protein
LLALLALIGVVAVWLGMEFYLENEYAAASLALNRHDYKMAAAHIRACLDLRPSRFRFQLLAAQASRGAGNYREAGEHLAHCQELAGDKTDVTLLERMLLRAQQGDLANVEEVLWSLVDNNHPEKLHILEALGRGYMQNYRLPHAEKCLKMLVDEEPDHADAWFWRAQIFDLLGSQGETIRLYQRALDIEPSNDDRRLALAQYLLHANQTREAMGHFERLQERLPQNPDVMVGLAGCYLEAGRLEDGAALLDQALALEPNHVNGLTQMGRLTLLQGDAAGAEAWARKALVGEPSERSAHYLLFQCLERRGNKAEARKQQERLKALERDLARLEFLVRHDLTSNPSNADAYCEVGRIFARQGYPKRGLPAFQHALRIDPDHLATHQALAKLYESSGNADAALRHQQKARQIESSRPGS